MTHKFLILKKGRERERRERERREKREGQRRERKRVPQVNTELGSSSCVCLLFLWFEKPSNEPLLPSTRDRCFRQLKPFSYLEECEKGGEEIEEGERMDGWDT